MTDPTTAAAKLLPCRRCQKPGRLCKREVRARYHVQEFDNARVECCDDDCGVAVIAPTDEEAVEIWNTRRQPAPPEGEPDEATIERVAEAIAMAGTSHFGDDTPYAQQDRLVKMMRRCEAQAAVAAYLTETHK